MKEKSAESNGDKQSHENENAKKLKMDTPDDLHRYVVDIDFFKLNPTIMHY